MNIEKIKNYEQTLLAVIFIIQTLCYNIYKC